MSDFLCIFSLKPVKYISPELISIKSFKIPLIFCTTFRTKFYRRRHFCFTSGTDFFYTCFCSAIGTELEVSVGGTGRHFTAYQYLHLSFCLLFCFSNFMACLIKPVFGRSISVLNGHGVQFPRGPASVTK